MAKFGCYVRRWKEDTRGQWKSWEETVLFQAEAHLEGTDEVWSLAETIVGKKWKKSHKTGWDIVELWMQPTRR